MEASIGHRHTRNDSGIGIWAEELSEETSALQNLKAGGVNTYLDEKEKDIVARSIKEAGERSG